MSDDLVKRLRWKAGAYAKEAADRIEELSNCVAVLEQQLRISETIREAVGEGRDKTFARMQARIEELEAKLAKVKEAFRINMMYALPDYTHEMFDKDYAKIIGETDA